MKSKLMIAVLAAGLLAVNASAKVVLHPVFTDHMVLQQQSENKIWGTAKPNKKVTVTTSWDGAVISTVSDAEGKWTAVFRTPSFGGPYTITVSDGKPVTLSDVLIGEVWLCGGQSNMEMKIGDNVTGMKETMAEADAYGDNIRLLHVENAVSPKPMEDVTIRHGGWQKCSGEDIYDFSAAGYYFGKYLADELGCPVGLIESCWGGTLAEAWTSAGSLKQMPYFRPQLEWVSKIPVEAEARHDLFLKEIREWGELMKTADPVYAGGPVPCTSPDYDDSGWKTIPVPGYVQNNGELGFDGVFWERTIVDIPEKWAGKELVLHLGAVDDNDFTFFNGVEVGHTEGCIASRDYVIPANLVKAGKAAIAVRVHDTGGLGGIAADPERIRLSCTDAKVNEDSMPLAGEWKYKVSMSLAKAPVLPVDASREANIATGLYNAMISPIVGYRIAGAIWYQGESNSSRAAQYSELLPLMINDWRQQWGYAFPFYIVQIANYMAVQEGAEESDWAELRESQVTATRLENTGLACIIDIGEAADIHPKNKVEVGRRLSLQALNKTYGKDIDCESPSYAGCRIEGGKMRIFFDNAEGLTAHGDKVEGFYIAGCDHVFHKADAVIEGNEVVVSSSEVAFPTAVRYAWANNPVCNLYNAAGLPTIPFRTDKYQAAKDL